MSDGRLRVFVITREHLGAMIVLVAVIVGCGPSSPVRDVAAGERAGRGSPLGALARPARTGGAVGQGDDGPYDQRRLGKRRAPKDARRLGPSPGQGDVFPDRAVGEALSRSRPGDRRQGATRSATTDSRTPIRRSFHTGTARRTHRGKHRRPGEARPASRPCPSLRRHTASKIRGWSKSPRSSATSPPSGRSIRSTGRIRRRKLSSSASSPGRRMGPSC